MLTATWYLHRLITDRGYHGLSTSGGLASTLQPRGTQIPWIPANVHTCLKEDVTARYHMAFCITFTLKEFKNLALHFLSFLLTLSLLPHTSLLSLTHSLSSIHEVHVEANVHVELWNSVLPCLSWWCPLSHRVPYSDCPSQSTRYSVWQYFLPPCTHTPPLHTPCLHTPPPPSNTHPPPSSQDIMLWTNQEHNTSLNPTASPHLQFASLSRVK